MVSEKAECLNCGYTKEVIVSGSRGFGSYPVKGCRKCKFIINFLPAKYGQEINECPICHNKDLIDYEKTTKEKFRECPKCGKKKLKFTLTGI